MIGVGPAISDITAALYLAVVIWGFWYSLRVTK